MAKPRLTKAGAVMLARAIAGNTLTFTRGAFGDAAGASAPSERQIDSLTSLLHEKMSLPIAGFSIAENKAVISLLVSNESVTSGFRVAEGGLFAHDSSSQADSLYAYFYDGQDGAFMPAGNQDVVLEYNYEFETAVSNAASVTCVIDKSITGVMLEQFEAHINSTMPHPNLDYVTHPEFQAHSISASPHPNWNVAMQSDLQAHSISANPHPNFDHVTHPEFQAHSISANPHPNWNVAMQSDLQAHSISANPHPNWNVQIHTGKGLSKSGDTINVVTASAQSLGGIKVGRNLYMEGESLNAAGEEGTDARIRQLEINQANLYILLNSLHQLGVHGDLVLVEDFSSLNSVDFYESAISITSTGFSLSADSIAPFRPSSSAVVTNGLLYNQLVSVNSIAADNGHCTITTDQRLSDTLSAGKLLRSSMTIRDGLAYGAGLVKKSQQKANRTWTGEGHSDTIQATFNAYSSLESSFTLDGDWSLTSDGFFTLD